MCIAFSLPIFTNHSGCSSLSLIYDAGGRDRDSRDDRGGGGRDRDRDRDSRRDDRGRYSLIVIMRRNCNLCPFHLDFLF